MNVVANHLTGIVEASFSLLLDSGPYLLFGLLLAGVIYVSFPAEKIVRHLGTKSFGAVLKAALVGVPLPLCSCGVVPTGLSIKRQGASTGSTLSFMIATPQTGVDSISLTYALLDPLFTIFRPVAAFITAVFTGIGANVLLHEEKVEETLRAKRTVTNRTVRRFTTTARARRLSLRSGTHSSSFTVTSRNGFSPASSLPGL